MTDPGKYDRVYQDDATAWDPDWAVEWDAEPEPPVDEQCQFSAPD